MEKERLVLEPLSSYILSLVRLEKDCATLEIRNNRQAVSRVKRELLKIEKEHHKPFKKLIESIRKEIDSS